MEILIHRDGKQLGPFSEDQVRKQLANGSLSSTDLAWHDGLAEWLPLSQVLTTDTDESQMAGAVEHFVTGAGVNQLAEPNDKFPVIGVIVFSAIPLCLVLGILYFLHLSFLWKAVIFAIIAVVVVRIAIWGARPRKVDIGSLVLENDLPGVEAMLKQSPELIRETNFFGATPLHVAAHEGKLEMVSLLIANGSEIDAKDKSDSTPLSEAVTQGHLEVAKLLLANKADVAMKGSCERTVLHAAVSENQKEIADLLLAHGADPNAQAKWGITPLSQAVSKNNREMVELLLARGGDPNTKTKDDTILKMAVGMGHTGIVELLRAHGASD